MFAVAVFHTAWLSRAHVAAGDLDRAVRAAPCRPALVRALQDQLRATHAAVVMRATHAAVVMADGALVVL
ncbi:MAG: hypothetical protein ACRDRV_01325 [Pseudonocardiaceae bacterium]